MTEPSNLEDAPIDTPPHPQKGALRAIFLIVLADLMGFGVIIPLLPFYARKYAASDFQVGLLFSIYSACQLVGSPILGLISDRYGRRPVLIASQAGSVIGFLLLGYATYGDWSGAPVLGLTLVYISRVIHGFSGGYISTALAYVSDVTTAADRAKGMGLLGAAFGIGFSIGPALGGILGHFDVSLPAFAAAGFCALAVWQTWRYLPESRVHKPSETEAWLHPSRFLPILGNAPLMQMLLIFFFSMMAFVMMESILAIFLADLMNYGELQVGLLFGLAGLVIVVVQGRMVGKWSKRFGEWPLVIAGPVMVAIAMLMMALLGIVPALWLLVLAIIANATGRSLQQPTLSAVISHESDANQQGTVFGLFHMLGSLARVVGPIIATGIYTNHPVAPFLLAGGITLAAAGWSALVWQRVRRRAVAAPAYSS